MWLVLLQVSAHASLKLNPRSQDKGGECIMLVALALMLRLCLIAVLRTVQALRVSLTVPGGDGGI